jgi:hypothetical protein
MLEVHRNELDKAPTLGNSIKQFSQITLPLETMFSLAMICQNLIPKVINLFHSYKWKIHN